MEDSRVEAVRAALRSVYAGQLEEFDSQLADDIVWHVGGEHPLSGDYRGRQAVLDYHARVAELTSGSLQLEPIDVLAGDHFLGVFVRATADSGGQKLDTTMVEAIRLSEDGKWAEFWALAEDQGQVDSFWSEMAK